MTIATLKSDSEAVIESDKDIRCKPFLKWVGGKTQLLPELLARIPKAYNTYFEPFVGGGALFFALRPQHASLSDLNDELINAYQAVKEDVEQLIVTLGEHSYEQDYFYALREVDRSKEYAKWSSVARAARLIYLNKTCFNGLYRVNSKGYFNTPFGRYTNPRIVDSDNLRKCSRVLNSASLFYADFRTSLRDAQSGDFVYIDPPYIPLSDTSYFTSYSKDGFGFEEQVLLKDTCRELDRRGVKFMASNSASEKVFELYKEFNIETVLASRAVNSKASKRGKIEEVIIRNYA